MSIPLAAIDSPLHKQAGTWCAACRVQLAPDARVCPLCKGPVSLGLSATEAPSSFPSCVDKRPGLSARIAKRRALAFAIISGITLVPAVLCLAIEKRYGGVAGWSFIVLASLGLFWGFAFAGIAFYRHPLPLVVSIPVLVGIYLRTLDELLGFSGWSLSLGWPLCAVSIVMLLLYWVCSQLLKKHPGIRCAVWFALTALWSLGIDFCISTFRGGHGQLSWSIVVASALLPLAFGIVLCTFVYVHSKTLQRVFHW